MKLNRSTLSLLALFTACADDAAMRPADDAEGSVESSCPPELPEFSTGRAGLTVMDPKLGIKVRVDDADYQPPRFGTNTWTIAVTDAADQSLPAAQLTWACAFMPLHGHGSNPRVVEKLDATRWRLGGQNMAMQGVWEIRLWIDPDGGSEEFRGAQAGGLQGNACRAPDGGPETLRIMTCVPRQLGE